MAMMLGEIRSWRPEKGPSTARLMEIQGRPLQAVYLPRGALEGTGELAELAGAGVYFLVGPGPAPNDRPRVFIGGTQNLHGALLDHRAGTPFAWEAAVAIPLKPPRVPRFHKELTKLVQFHCHRQAVRVQNHDVVNPAPAPPSLVPAFVDRDLKVSQTAIQTLLYALGHPVLGGRLRPAP
jgi:hypothetical protein